MKIIALFVLILLSLSILTCDHGLKPAEEEKAKMALSGTVYYSNWLPADSIQLLKIVFFKTFPPENIINEVLGGNASIYPLVLSESLPLDEDSTNYEIELKAETYTYITVAQQYGPDVFTQWRAVGQYNTNPGDSLPTAVTVLEDSILYNINIFVDFNNLPPQHFETP
jgi:hypothetical protein